MYITGYHGTTKERAKKIVEENKFNISNENDEWLGKGIYFYEKYSDYLIYNENNSEEFKQQISNILDIMTEE